MEAGVPREIHFSMICRRKGMVAYKKILQEANSAPLPPLAKLQQGYILGIKSFLSYHVAEGILKILFDMEKAGCYTLLASRKASSRKEGMNDCIKEHPSRGWAGMEEREPDQSPY
jgi:hypothetical protein